jgi:hypothetical protein
VNRSDFDQEEVTMVDAERHLFIKHLITNVKCAVCQHPYQPDDIQVIEDHEDLWVLSVVCSECRTQGLIFAVVREVPTESEPTTEAEDDGWAEFEVMPAIDQDEVLDMHRMLRDFSGDVFDLLQR